VEVDLAEWEEGPVEVELAEGEGPVEVELAEGEEGPVEVALAEGEEGPVEVELVRKCPVVVRQKAAEKEEPLEQVEWHSR
jgi:hypothetical protein